MSNEKNYSPINGYLMILVILILLIGGVALLRIYLGIFLIILGVLCLAGFVLVNPNGSRVLLLFGKYVGTIKKNGFFLGKPIFYQKENFITGQ